MSSLASFSALLLFFLTSGVTSASRIRIYNACPFTVWPGWIPNMGHPQLGSGGASVPTWKTCEIEAPVGWAGRFWGRTGCRFDQHTGRGQCETGDCNGAFGCSTSGLPPATLVEFTPLGGDNGLDYYDVSVVDGYNLPIRVSPGDVRCGLAGCNADVNSKCPHELAVRNKGGYTVACKSACQAYGDDRNCCRGIYNNPSMCKPGPFTHLFKEACPKAYTYPFDSSTLTCTTGADYTITFCPNGGVTRASGNTETVLLKSS